MAAPGSYPGISILENLMNLVPPHAPPTVRRLPC
ncbi:hypothetical protein BH20ACT1_BH20ACT1_10530 [soil metagenome]